MQWVVRLCFLSLLLHLALTQRSQSGASPPLPPPTPTPSQSKFFAHYVMDRSTLLLRRKIFIYKNELYTPWSEWSNCSTRDCTELRYRQCLNDSYESWIPNLFQTNNCPFQFIAETRRCTNDAGCRKEAPSKLLKELSSTCGKRPNFKGKRGVSPKILGGREAKPHSWPWQVALYVRPLAVEGRSLRSPTIESPFCGATLIAPSWLITAAHCLSELVPDKVLTVGHFFSVEEELEQTIHARIGDHVRGKRDGSHEVTRQIELAITHPDYRRGFSEQGFDVALLKLDQPVEFGDKVSSICIPNRSLHLPEGQICYAAGWGATAPDTSVLPEPLGFIDFFSGGLFPRPCGLGQTLASSRRCRGPRQPLRLLEVDLPLVSLQRCRRTFRNLREWVHICAGEKGKDTCRGDSGGGLFCQNPEDGRWYIYGVTSFGSVLGCGEHYGVYACTRGISDWIHENVK
ncbi:Mastin [Echinococcus multilocularis]|uniref:Mastin n=1 Tax=Echinococcus multilocularis TaxID=6211 RepID=A0A087VY24_ECHMU|nr:Mastin [Echinococcus multilocularis]